MFNKDIFEKAVNQMTEIILKFQETNELHAIRRDVGANFAKIFKDSLFEYNDGIILLERFYKEKVIKSDAVNFPVMKDSDKELINKLEDLSNSIPPTSQLSNEDVEKYSNEINKLCSDIQEIKPQYEEGYIEYVSSPVGKVLTLKLSEMSKEEVLSRSLLSVSLALSMYESLFLVDEFDEGVSILSIEHDEYVDLIILPYSEDIKKDTNEDSNEDTLEENILEEEIDNNSED